MHSQDYYRKMRERYTPDKIRVIFLLESPPASGKYFYNTAGKTNELLFSAMMKYINFKPINKEEGLQKFRDHGFLIVDAILEPVNKIKDKKARNKKIVINIPHLIDEISLFAQPKTKIVPIKRNINLIFTGILKSLGYKICDADIPFPDRFHLNEFLDKMNSLKIRF